MNIGRQWEDRLRIWSEQFEKHYLLDRIDLDMTYFTTMAQIPFAEAVKGAFQSAPAGTVWGRKWEYGWFHTTLTVPASWEGERVVIYLRTAQEMLLWVNGTERGSIDRGHPYVTLTRSAAAGEVFDIYAECYAGHGIRSEGAGPVAYGEQSVPEPPERQVTTGQSFAAWWNETVFQAAMDYRTLYSLVKKLPDKSLRAMKIIEGLKRFTMTADFELPEPALTASVAQADQLLKPLLACTNGSTAPEYTIFGQSHLDMAWLWPVEETMRKAARTYTNQLALMEEYPSYRFLMCEPPILEYLKTLYPDVYRRVRAQTEAGAFMPEGAMWIESDTNIPSGESLIRQFVWGRRWFRRECGVEARMAWMPDTFGFSAALPQIMRKCGVTCFATQKLVRQDPEAEPFPYNVFWWEGLDGSRVLSHLFKKNNANLDAGDLITRWEDDRVQTEGIDGMLYPFGFGDGGGGPTREMLEIALRCRDLEGAPRCRMESPLRFFERQQQVENVYRGELYLAWHRGTLTSQSRTKRALRRAEVRLKQAEYCLARQLLRGEPIRRTWREQIEQAWTLLLFNQFHDIATGTSIERVHQRAEQQLRQAGEMAGGIIRAILGTPGEQPVVHNHLGWDIRFRGQTIPAQGCARLKHAACAERATVRPSSCGYVLRNARITCTVNTRGELVSVRDASGWEYLSGTANRMLMFRDVNTCYDAWELGSMYEAMPVTLSDDAVITAGEDEYGAFLVVERMLGSSRMEQTIRLEHEGMRVDFITKLDWRERHRMLKVAFPLCVYTEEALHEVQFGYVRRPTHRSRRYDRDRYEVSNQRYTALADGGHGAAVLNDCKYGVNVREKEIRLTLMKAPMMPDMNADQGLQEFTYAFYPFAGDFAHSGVLREAMELNEPPLLGDREDESGVFVSLCPNVVVDTVKPADTVGNAILVRVWESAGMQTQAEFALNPRIQRVMETNMMEEEPRVCSLRDGLRADFGPFEIKTFLLYL